MGVHAIRSNYQAKYVVLAAECLRTGVRFPPPPPLLKVPTLIGWDFFCLFPSENGIGLARVASTVAQFPTRFPQIPLSVISRDASARDATSSIFNDLQAAGSISNLVGRWGIGKRIGTVPEFTLVASAHSLMALRALAAQNY